MENIESNIRIFMPGYSPADCFLSKKEAYIKISIISRRADFEPTMYCIDGYGYRAWAHTFDKAGKDKMQAIESFKDCPKELIQRLQKRGFRIFK